MKYILVILVFVNLNAFACSQDYLEGHSAQNKFLVTVNYADFVFIGEVIRTYRIIGTPDFFKNDNGYVFKVTELIKGESLPYMDAEQSWWCGVNGPNMKNYWPDEIGDEFVITGKTYRGEHRIIAVYPLEKAVFFMSEIVEMATKSLTPGS